VVHAARCKYRTQKLLKNRHLGTIAQLCRAISPQLRHVSTIGKKLFKQQYLLHMFPQYGELQPTSGWDRCGSLRHPCKFQRVSRLGSVTAQHSSIGRQPNFAVLNRGRHLYSAGRPSRWALAHILVQRLFCAGYYAVDIIMVVIEIAGQPWLIVADSGFLPADVHRSHWMHQSGSV